MATIRVQFNVPDGDYCTTKINSNKCRFRAMAQVKEDRYIIKCRLFDVDLINVDYEDRLKRGEAAKCELCLNAHVPKKTEAPQDAFT